MDKSTAPRIKPRVLIEKNANLFLWSILAVSAILHAWYLWQFSQTPYFASPLVDAASYHRKALAILSDGWLGKTVPYQAPLYPYFLAVVYKLLGPDSGAAQWLQGGGSVCSVWLLYRIGKALFNTKVGLASAALAAFYGVFIYHSALLLKESLSIFFACLFLLLFFEAAASRWRCLLSGILIGVGITLRGNFLLVFAAFFLWLLVFPAPRCPRVKNALAFLLGAALIIAPITARNYFLEKDFVLVNYDAGPNFFIGNNPLADGYYSGYGFVRANPRFEEIDYREKAEKIAGRKLKASEISRFWFKMGFAFIAEKPLDYLKLLFKKLLIFVNHYEKADNYNFYFMKTVTPALSLGFVSFGALLLAALMGIYLGRLATRPAWICYIYILTYTLSVVVFYVNSRYRLPVVPALIPFAAYALTEGWGKIQNLQKTEAVLFAAIIVAASWAIFRPVPQNSLSIALSNYGEAFERVGQTDKAIAAYQQALQAQPAHSLSAFNLAEVYRKKNIKSDAEIYYRKALGIDPQFTEARINLAQILLEKDSFEEAIAEFRDALKDGRHLPQIHALMGFAFASRKMWREAEVAYRVAIQLEPDEAANHNGLATVYINAELYDPAINELREAVKIDPGYADAHYNLGIAYHEKGLLSDSAREFQEAQKP